MANKDTAAAELRRQLSTLKADFDGYRRRTREEIAEARERGRDEAVLSLTDVVDDCDRALSLTYANSDHNRLLEGLQQMRDRVVRRFEEVGLQSFGTIGEDFDPHHHNAIATEPSPGTPGRIVRVHQRGWRRKDGTVVRTAMVTVSAGFAGGRQASELGGFDDTAPRQRRHRPACRFGVPGCTGECVDCRLQSEIDATGGAS